MPQTHTPATGASPPTLEQVRSIAERAIAERIGKPFPDGVLDVRQDAGDDATLIVQVNSGGNAIAAESALARAGYDVVPISPPDDVSYGVVIGVRVADPLASLSPEVRALAAEGLRQHGLTEGAAALDSAASRPDRSAHPLFAEVLAAREKAHAKHGDNSIERVPAGDSRWLPILGEEFGEVCSTQTYDKDAAELRAELIDTLAVASAWVDAIDRDRRGAITSVWPAVLAARPRTLVRLGPSRTDASDPQWLPALGDQVGVVCETLAIDPGVKRLRSDLIGVLAVASAWVDAIDRAAISS